MKAMKSKDENEGGGIGKYDKDRLTRIAIKAIGKRKIKQFCADTSLSDSLVSKLINGKLPGPPSLKTIERFSEGNQLIAEEMKMACGYPINKRMTIEKQQEDEFALEQKSIPNTSQWLSFVASLYHETKRYSQIIIEYHFDDLFFLRLPDETTTVCITSTYDGSKQPDEVFSSSIDLFAKALLMGDNAANSYLFLTNSPSVFQRLTNNLPNLCYKIGVILSDGLRKEDSCEIRPLSQIQKGVDAQLPI